MSENGIVTNPRRRFNPGAMKELDELRGIFGSSVEV